ncbi:thermopsin [Metallosphaera hakonensis]|uniref:Thermopsin n=1 Tax=Metallosphaera hakonensis JCM 8857 = DSM 7519 TaxID=1293036 RepID=A0A2U9IQZ2_9CREN|nr:thermopsin [Metallosphaera hakonensis]AWR98452.1 hypothetical protein DFR87_00565 [Metallosphaera hakonensis JCM 8857 = DSM 7519]
MNKLLSIFLLLFLVIEIMPLTDQVIQTTPLSSHEHASIHDSALAFSPIRANATLANKFVPEGVNVYGAYQSEPAPMGIADYGLGPNGPFIRTTTQFLGFIYLGSLSASSMNGTQFVNNCASFQMNVVLNYQYNGQTYALWVQDVARFNTNNNQVFFIDNIWNYTSNDASVYGLSGNGNTGTSFYGQTPVQYYYYYATGYPGSFVTLSLPTTILLLVNVSTNNLGQPVIRFWYDDGYGWVSYDTVTVTNVEYASNVYFLIDGYKYTGWGTFYDAELVLAGAYSGMTAYVNNSSVYLNLEYWNGQNFQGVRNAYNFGSDTAETAQDVTANYYYAVFSGTLVSGLFSGSGSLGQLWNQSDVSTLIINTGINSGYLMVYNSTFPYSQYYSQEGIPFDNGGASLTIEPGNYAVLVYNQNRQLIGEANVNAQFGTVSTGVTQFNIFASTTSVKLSPGSSSSLDITVNAYGNVNLNVLAPSGIGYNIQSPINVNGQTTDVLTLYSNGAPPGVYMVIVNATLFPGFYKLLYITVTLGQPSYSVSFSYSVLGQPPSQSPQITLDFPNGTITTVSMNSLTTLNLPQGTTYTIQDIIGGGNGVRWATNSPTQGTVNGQATINLVYREQYLVTFNSTVQGGQGYQEPEVTYYYFGQKSSTVTPNTVWVDYDSHYQYENMLQGSSTQERWIAYSYSGTVTSPETVNVYYYNQYYVNVASSLPVYAIINGENITLTSGWYNQSTSVQIENLTYYTSPNERYVMTSISPSLSFTINSPIGVKVQLVKQYYLTVSSPIPVYAFLNDTNISLRSAWYDAGSVINVENLTYYPSPDERYVITGISPSSFTLNSPNTVSISTLTQYFVRVNSTIPVKAIINGSSAYLNSSWMNENTIVLIQNYTYNVNSGERYVIINISPESAVLTRPLTFNIEAQKQFNVTINGVSRWYPSGSTVYLNASIPFYDTGEFKGTYDVLPGSAITVNGPIKETLVESPNYLVIGSMAGAVVAAIVVVLVIVNSRKKGKAN